MNGMKVKKQSLIFWGLNALAVLLAMIIQYNGTFTVRIGGANPMLPLCICLAFSMLSGEVTGVITSLFIGIVTDSAASTPAYFHTIVFMLFSLSVALTVRYVFNNNVRSAAVIGICDSLLYYLLRFLFCVPKNGAEDSVGYLMQYALPSVIYTSVLVIPIYFFYKWLFNRYYTR